VATKQTAPTCYITCCITCHITCWSGLREPYTQIKKYMREKKEEMKHQFDVMACMQNIKKTKCCQQEKVM